MPRYAFEDLICPDGHRSRHFVSLSEDLPMCVGRRMHMDGENGETVEILCRRPLYLLSTMETAEDAAGVRTFKPFDYEGKSYTSQDDWNREKALIAENLKIDPSELVETSPDRARDRVRADEAAHRGYLGRKASGHDEQSYREHVREQRRKTGKEERIGVGWGSRR